MRFSLPNKRMAGLPSRCVECGKETAGTNERYPVAVDEGRPIGSKDRWRYVGYACSELHRDVFLMRNIIDDVLSSGKKKKTVDKQESPDWFERTVMACRKTKKKLLEIQRDVAMRRSVVGQEDKQGVK